MTAKTKGRSAARPLAAPTYQELADLVAELTVVNIANLDSESGKHRFVSCFTYGVGHIPPHWQRAIDAREALIASRIVERKGRTS